MVLRFVCSITYANFRVLLGDFILGDEKGAPGNDPLGIDVEAEVIVLVVSLGPEIPRSRGTSTSTQSWTSE